MDGDNTEKLTLHDYEAEGLCSGCLFYGAVDVDGRLDAHSTGLTMSLKTGITVKTVMSCAACKGGDKQCTI